MPFVQDDLRCDVLRSAGEGPRFSGTNLLAKTEIHLQETSLYWSKSEFSIRVTLRRVSSWIILIAARGRDLSASRRSVSKYAHQFQVTARIEHKILRFEISIDDIQRMQMVESLYYAAHHKLRGGVIEVSSPLQGRPHISTKAHLH